VVAELLWRLVPDHQVHLFCYEARDIPPEVKVHRFRRPLDSYMAGALWIVARSWLAVWPRRFDAVISQGGNALNQTHAVVHACQAQRWELTREVYWELAPPRRFERWLRTFWYRVTTALEGRAVRRCRHGRTLAVSAELARQLSRYHGVPREGITVCENGVDHTRFRPDPYHLCREHIRVNLGVGEEDLLVLFLGGLWLEKGATYSVEALAHTGPHVHLCLAGRDDPEPFRQRAEALGVQDRLHFLPATEKPWEYYLAADTFLFPGHSEGFGLVALEAAACGLPVLMTRVGVAERLIQDGVSGYLIDQDPVQIARRLDELAADPEWRRQLGEGARQSSLQFTWDRQAAEIEAALQRGQRR
jgi:UDP-glucose:(heptosyl)LPS alpha-1,3-glucosyltransferase